MVKLKQLIFDVSGTLWNDKPPVTFANLKVLEENGFHIIPKEINNGIEGEKVSYEWLNKNLVGSAPEQFKRFGMSEDYSYLEILYKKAFEITYLENPVKLYDGIEDILSHLFQKSIKNTIISSHPQKHLVTDLKRLKIHKYFENILGSTHNKTQSIKSHSKLYNLPENQIGYIGDTYSDMITANQAGVRSIGVSYGYQTKNQIQKANPEIVLESTEELLVYLLNKIN